MKKTDLIKILIDEYGYEKEDLKFDENNKPYTNAKLQALIDAEVEDAKKSLQVQTRIVQKQQFKGTDEILVMSGSMGGVIYNSKNTGAMYEFKSFGQTMTMPFSELTTIKNAYSSLINDCYIIILDEELQGIWNLKDKYKDIIMPDTFEGLFELEKDELVDKIKKMPKAMQILVSDKAKELYHTQKLVNLLVIKELETLFGFSFEDGAPTDDFAFKGETSDRNVIYVEKK